MHICFAAIDFHMSHGGGGIASYVQTLGQEFVRRGHVVSIIAKGRSTSWQTIDGIRVFTYPFSEVSWYIHRLRILRRFLFLPIRELEWSRSISRALHIIDSLQRIDIIESCESGIQSLARFGRPHIIRLHGEPYVFRKYSSQPMEFGLRLNRKLEFRSLRKANAVTSPSLFQATEVSHDLDWQTGIIHVIPNPVSNRFFEHPVNVTLNSDEELSENKGLDVLYTGRMEYTKGFKVLLEAASLTAKRIPKVRFVVAGGHHNSIPAEVINNTVRQLKLENHIKLLGHIKWEQLAVWYRRAAVFLMPSYYETFSISCAEAMAFGLPVVATTAGGIPEVVQDGVTGILVPPGDPQSVSDALVSLLSDKQRISQMGESGRKRALDLFEVGKIADTTLQLYEKAICAS